MAKRQASVLISAHHRRDPGRPGHL